MREAPTEAVQAAQLGQAGLRIANAGVTANPAQALLFAMQAIALGKGPHIIVGTPGRVVDHLSNTKGFSLKLLKHLVLDEADRLLHMDFEQEIDQILKVIPRVRPTSAHASGS